jgi:hypothetical protein
MQILDNTTIEHLIMVLQDIAKKNNDSFKYRIEIHPTSKDIVQYRFACVEDADEHEFLTGYGNTIQDAINTAARDLNEACKEWGYKR